MENQGIDEKDWKLFRSRIADWQERYMQRLIDEYEKIIQSDQNASDKFWELEKRIKNDKRDAGVVCEMRRSVMLSNIFELLHEKAITIEDLDGFSEELLSFVRARI